MEDAELKNQEPEAVDKETTESKPKKKAKKTNVDSQEGSDSCSRTTPYPSTRGKTMQQIDHDAWQWAVDNGLI